MDASPENYDAAESDSESMLEDIDLKEETSPTSPTDVFSTISTNTKASLAVKHSTNQQKRRRVTRYVIVNW